LHPEAEQVSKVHVVLAGQLQFVPVQTLASEAQPTANPSMALRTEPLKMQIVPF
jgi:hypothetical protein